MERNQTAALSGRARLQTVGPGAQLTLFEMPPEPAPCHAFRSHPSRPRRPAVRDDAPRRFRRDSSPQQHGVTHAPRTPTGTVGRIYERMYNGFRMKLFDAMGPRYGNILREAEREVRFLNPDFDVDLLTDATAIAIPELIEATIRRAPFFHRASLRKAACLLISDLYEKNYEHLESAGVLARLEDIYYRLKR